MAEGLLSPDGEDLIFIEGWAPISPTAEGEIDPGVLCGVAAHLLPHIDNLTADPLHEPVQL